MFNLLNKKKQENGDEIVKGSRTNKYDLRAIKKQEGGQLAKCYIRLRELGGQYENEYVCAVFGNLASCVFNEGDLVVASLRFQTHEANGQYYQDIVVNDLIKLSK